MQQMKYLDGDEYPEMTPKIVQVRDFDSESKDYHFLKTNGFKSSPSIYTIISQIKKCRLFETFYLFIVHESNFVIIQTKTIK